MECTVGASLLFAAAVIWLFCGAYIFKRTEKKQAGMTWLAVLFVVLNCYHTFIAALLDLAHLPVNIITIGIADLLAGAYFWYQIYKKKARQKYEYALVDILFAVTLIGAVALFAVLRYRGLNLNYMTIDPANHFKAAMDLVNSQSITSMFYETVWNGLFIELLGPLTSVDYYYKWFILSDLINLGLSAFVFYGFVRRYFKDRYTKAAGYVLAVIYMIGYPMCSTMYGFVYLGMGVTVIGMLLIAVDMYLKEEMGKWLNVVLLMLGCLAVFECYVLFMPITFFAIIFCIFQKQQRKKRLVSKDTVLTCLAVFLIPCLIGFVYTYMGIFTDGVTVSNAIVNEGACYRELYADFLPYLPLALLGVIGLCKKKEQSLLLYLTPLTVFFTAVMLWRTIRGEASTYYYYKIYFLLWLIVLILAFMGVVYAQQQTRVLITCGFGIWCMVMGMYLGKVEQKLQFHNELLVSEERAGSVNPIITYNYEVLYMPVYSKEKEELYHYAYTELADQTDKLVPMAGYWEDDLWYQAITNQRYYGWGQSDPDHTDYFNHLNESGAEYITVLKDSQIYSDEQEYFDSLDKLFENSVGFVARLKL